MNRFLRLLPWTFILIRAVSGPLFIYACFPNVLPSYWSALTLLLFHLGFWGDIFDGILARYLKMDSTRMRKMDSFADVLFWIGITVFCYHQFVPARQPLLFGLLSISPLIAFDYIHCFVKFKKSPSAHALFASVASA